MTEIRADSRHAFDHAIKMAMTMKQAEIAVALREPARKIICLLKNRSNDLAQIDRIVADQGHENWGLF
jgi:hypothetical protein